MIGSAMIEMIKNLNSDFSFDKGLPRVDANEAMRVCILFSVTFEAALRLMKKLNKKVRIVA